MKSNMEMLTKKGVKLIDKNKDMNFLVAFTFERTSEMQDWFDNFVPNQHLPHHMALPWTLQKYVFIPTACGGNWNKFSDGFVANWALDQLAVGCPYSIPLVHHLRKFPGPADDVQSLLLHAVALVANVWPEQMMVQLLEATVRLPQYFLSRDNAPHKLLQAFGKAWSDNIGRVLIRVQVHQSSLFLFWQMGSLMEDDVNVSFEKECRFLLTHLRLENVADPVTFAARHSVRVIALQVLQAKIQSKPTWNNTTKHAFAEALDRLWNDVGEKTSATKGQLVYLSRRSKFLEYLSANQEKVIEKKKIFILFHIK